MSSYAHLSSDLWVLPPVQSGEPTGKTTALDYAQGHVEGPIELAQLEFAGYTIPKQAFSKNLLCIEAQ
jgi:hypothetical protein